ncbi:MAG: transcriptional repressor [Actinobacteria bacterium]|nr:MAG: transcriptional repressor [Actinomycetota bacterium]
MSGQTHAPAALLANELFGGSRLSVARRAIAEAVRSLGGAFTAEELHEAVASSREGIGVATVYRAVAAMTAAGSLAPVGSRKGSTLYALCAGGDHHHHLVCTGCGTVVGIACPVDGSLMRSAEDAGYTVTAHEVTLYGLCAACTRARD